MANTPMPRRQARLGCLFPIVMSAGLLVLAAISLLAWYQWRYADKIYPGVSVGGVPLGGLTVDEAESVIMDALTPYPGPDVTLRFGDQQWILSAGDLGVSVDASATASQAFAVGRHGLASNGTGSVLAMFDGLERDMADQWEAMRGGVAVQPVLARDEDLQAQVVARIAEEVNICASRRQADHRRPAGDGHAGPPGPSRWTSKAPARRLLKRYASGAGDRGRRAVARTAAGHPVSRRSHGESQDRARPLARPQSRYPKRSTAILRRSRPRCAAG